MDFKSTKKNGALWGAVVLDSQAGLEGVLGPEANVSIPAQIIARTFTTVRFIHEGRSTYIKQIHIDQVHVIVVGDVLSLGAEYELPLVSAQETRREGLFQSHIVIQHARIEEAVAADFLMQILRSVRNDPAG